MVCGRRRSRDGAPRKTLTPAQAGDFGILSRKATGAVLAMTETHRLLKAYLERIFTEAKSLPPVKNVRWSETHRAEAEPIPEALPPTRRRH